VIVLAFIAVAARASSVVHLTNWRISFGDDRTWSEVAFDDSAWDEITFRRVPQSDSIAWLRTHVRLETDLAEPGKPLGIFVAAIASHEIWWDGVLIGSGGVVGPSPDAEIPGPLEAHYVIPSHLTEPGDHVVAMRTSHFHRHFVPSIGYWIMIVGPYDFVMRPDTRSTRTALISLSGIIVMAIFSFMMFLADRRERAFLFLGLLCLTAGLLLVAESWRALVGYTYNWHLLRLSIVTALAWVFDVLLLVFLARRFPMAGAKWFVAIGVSLATIPILTSASWDPKAILGFLFVFLLSLAWCVAAVVRRLPGSVLATIGLGVCLIALSLNPGAFVDRNIYVSVNVLMIFLLASHTLRVRQIRMEREEALVKSARLEIELLRKHIQPHFLMNTLTALSEWIEQEPQVAIEMIDALSEEFRLLSDIAHRKLIPIEEELRLCRSHLDIMSRRSGRTFRLETRGIDPRDSIPPAVFHTLIENAITHNHYEDSETTFDLAVEKIGDRIVYRLTTPLSGAGVDETTEIPEGTGLRYIRARLTEAYRQDWSLAYRRSNGVWITEIGVPATRS